MIKEKTAYKVIEKNADMLTPIGIFKRLQGEKKFLLESSFQHETKGKYSYIGMNPYQEVVGHGNVTTVTQLPNGEKQTFQTNALTYLHDHLPSLNLDLPLPFTGGAIGYAGYDAVRQFMEIGEELPDEIGMPDYHFMLYQTIIAYEHRTEKAYIITINLDECTDDELEDRIRLIEKDLDQPFHLPEPDRYEVHFKPQTDKARFIEKVNQAKKHISDGEATQIVLSQRMVADIEDDPFAFYRQLRSANPSPYMFYIDFTDYLIIGTSPESLVQTNGNQVVTNPIAGTRPRGKTEREDQQLEKELLSDQKELAEHEMLVDLSKEDLAGICKHVHVPVYMDVMRYEHVMHIVSEVHGELNENRSSLDALLACLPAGTVSGAPKERAMQIINELETVKRGFYAGGIGYISFNHDVNLAIAIRSLVVKDQKAYLQAGAGIVADSIPEKEFEETLHKARSLTNLHKQ